MCRTTQYVSETAWAEFALCIPWYGFWPVQFSIWIWKASYLPRQPDWAPPPPFSSVNHPSGPSNEVSRTAYVWEIKGWKRGHRGFNREKKKKKKFPACNGREPSSGSFLTRFLRRDTFCFCSKKGLTFSQILPLIVLRCVLTHQFLKWWFHVFGKGRFGKM